MVLPVRAGRLTVSPSSRRIVASGALWALVYNLVWGLAWFGFMRTEWERTAAALGRPVPWTAEVWFLWALLTVPMGMASMAYTAGRASSRNRAGVSAAMVLWLLFTAPMGAYSLEQSVPVRVVVLDALVNLAGLLAASLAGTWSQREA